MRSHFLLLLYIVFPVTLFSFPGDGNGTTDDPFIITDIEELEEVRNNLSASFRLVNDIVLDSSADEKSTSWQPIAGDNSENDDFQGNAFSGTFAGGGHVIKNLYIHQPDKSFTGLFGYISGGKVDSLHLVDCNIHGNEIVGGLAGKISDSAVVTGCSVSGSIRGEGYTGGLIGKVSESSVSMCRTHGYVVGKHYIGGLFGQTYGYNHSIVDCYSTSAVSGYEYVGGVSGIVSKKLHKRCYATGPVTGVNYVGGVTGKGNLRTCFATGYVYGNNNYGGVLGDIETSSSTGCFWDVQTTGCNTCQTGIGMTSEEMKSASVLDLDFTNEWIIQDGSSYPGLRCFNNNPIAGSLFDTIAANKTCIIELSACDAEGDAIAGYELVTQPAFGSVSQDGAMVTYTPVKDYSGYDQFEFRAFDDNGNFSNIAKVTIAVILPFEGGDGTFRDPYRIATVNQLSSIRFHMSDSFVIVNDLDFEGSLYNSSNITGGWMPLGYTWREPFRGTLEGSNHEIRNMYISRSLSDRIGLFGRIDSGCVNNLIISDCSVTGSKYVGVLTGSNSGGDITGCHISGDVSGIECVGGITGAHFKKVVDNWIVYGRGILRCSMKGTVRGKTNVGGISGYSTGKIDECYTTGSVTGEKDVGGLVGNTQGTVHDSYSRTDVIGSLITGGLVGFSTRGIYRCYFAGTVSGEDPSPIGSSSGLQGKVVGCYWDMETAGVDTADSRYPGRTTAEMKNCSTYIADEESSVLRLWDFDSIWSISPDINDGYPYLQQHDLSIISPVKPGFMKMHKRSASISLQSAKHKILFMKLNITKGTNIRSALYLANGRRVTELINRRLPKGNYSFSFPLHQLPSGIYICKSVAGNFTDIHTFYHFE